jgi:hypothetical protein
MLFLDLQSKVIYYILNNHYNLSSTEHFEGKSFTD